MLASFNIGAPKGAEQDIPGDRRLVLKGSLAALAAAGGLAGPTITLAQDGGPTDTQILNFALNLEYLEAEFYLRAATGQGLTAAETSGSVGTQGSVKGGSQVPFEHDFVANMAAEIAADERAHVNFLRAALGANAVAEPQINFTDAFNILAQAAGLGSTFDPFANETNFIIGAFVFEDVGVTAYKGAAPLLDSKAILAQAAGILAVEAYHAGIIRTLIAQRGLDSFANKISAVRDQLDGNPKNQDMGTQVKGQQNLVPTNQFGVAYDRTATEVLGIVYAGGKANNFGFFPSKLNGSIR
ncbi:MAG TPA: ferritin-like domain-containing protein [Caulobacteraceae bacterium]|jgi:hypothetical protein